MKDTALNWNWTKYVNGRPNMGGDNSRNFRNENDPEIDGSLFVDEPISSAARFLAREAVQNSVDASRDLRFTSTHGEEALRVDFRFVELYGAEKESFVEAAGLRELALRSASLDNSASAKNPGTCLRELDADEPVRLLFVDEYGASGMYGPWDDSLGRSKMSLALLSGNISDKPANAGGAYGHGKSVNALASKIRVNFAYTCYTNGDSDSEQEVTRRLVGITYWPDHRVGDDRFLGWGIMGGPGSSDMGVVPWINEEADGVAQALGFHIRTSAERRLNGTSLLIVDPAMEPEEIVRAAERYWWPAIERGFLRISVTSSDGSVKHVRPRTHATIKNFVSAFNGILSPSDQAKDQMWIERAPRVQALEKPSGTISLVPAPIPADDAIPREQYSVVAQTRDLGMVVRYRKMRIGPAFVHGVFVAEPDAEVEILLNKAEPKAHDKWLATADEGNDELRNKIRLLVNNIERFITAQVRQYSGELKPADDSRPVRFKELDRLLGALLTDDGTKPPPPPGAPRDFSISRKVLKKQAVGSGSLKVSGSVRIMRIEDDAHECLVSIRYFIRDESGRREQIGVEVTPPTGFTQVGEPGSSYQGPCDDSPLDFNWETTTYSRGWIGDLDVEVEKYGA